MILTPKRNRSRSRNNPHLTPTRTTRPLPSQVPTGAAAVQLLRPDNHRSLTQTRTTQALLRRSNSSSLRARLMVITQTITQLTGTTTRSAPVRTSPPPIITIITGTELRRVLLLRTSRLWTNISARTRSRSVAIRWAEAGTARTSFLMRLGRLRLRRMEHV